MSENKKTLAALLVVAAVVGVVYIFCLVFGYTGREGAIEDNDDNKIDRPSIDLPVELLAHSWDSEDSPVWPVTELMAELCELAYQPPVEVKESYKEFGFQDYETLADGSMLGYVFTYNKSAVIVFRGTDNTVDWIVNLVTTTTSVEHGDIHRGFSNACQPLQSQVKDALQKHKIKRVWLCGHSLGGALAIVSAYDLLADQNIDVAGVVTFGQPAVAKFDLAQYIDTRLLGKYARFVNRNDIVPRLPVTFKPCGRLVWFTDEGLKRSAPKRVNFRFDDATKLDADDIDEIEAMTASEFNELRNKLNEGAQKKQLPDGTIVYGASFNFIKDHDMEQYLGEIRALLDARSN
jgi:triacylglycerol lipase